MAYKKGSPNTSWTSRVDGEQKSGKNVYEIANGAGDWVRSSSSTHTAYVTEENTRLGKKLKPLIRFFKAWKYYCNAPIFSFYLELSATKWMEGESSIAYDIDLCTILKKLHSCSLVAMQDSNGVSGYVVAYATEAKRADALSKLATAKTRAEKAREAERAGKTGEAFDWWGKVFAGNFPSYY